MVLFELIFFKEIIFITVFEFEKSSRPIRIMQKKKKRYK
jgi:hypothetical protein